MRLFLVVILRKSVSFCKKFKNLIWFWRATVGLGILYRTKRCWQKLIFINWMTNKRIKVILKLKTADDFHDLTVLSNYIYNTLYLRQNQGWGLKPDELLIGHGGCSLHHKIFKEERNVQVWSRAIFLRLMAALIWREISMQKDVSPRGGESQTRNGRVDAARHATSALYFAY